MDLSEFSTFKCNYVSVSKLRVFEECKQMSLHTIWKNPSNGSSNGCRDWDWGKKRQLFKVSTEKTSIILVLSKVYSCCRNPPLLFNIPKNVNKTKNYIPLMCNLVTKNNHLLPRSLCIVFSILEWCERRGVQRISS